jgi:SAM-dependent methyltransferase
MVKLAAEIGIPRRALDVGCGDGKDVAFLSGLGAEVIGIDICEAAVLAARRRMQDQFGALSGTVAKEDARLADLGFEAYDLVVCYGLYHCLNDEDLAVVHKKVVRALQPGGLFAFAVFNDELPMPGGHFTEGIILRRRNHMPDLLRFWQEISLQHGEIVEDHLPLVQTHRHSLTWGLYQKPPRKL